MQGKINYKSRHRPRLRQFVLRRYAGWHRVRASLRFAHAHRGSGRTVTDQAAPGVDTEAACAGARLLCAGGRVSGSSNGSGRGRARLLVSVDRNVCRAHLDRDSRDRHRPYQRGHAHLGARYAAEELEGASQPVGAVPYCWYLGSGRGVCALLNGRGTQAGCSLTFENLALATWTCCTLSRVGNRP